MVEVSHRIHWLRYSLRCDYRAVRDSIGGEWSEPVERPAYNQPRHVLHETGARLYYGSEFEHQPNVLDVAGEVCDGYAEFFRHKGAELGGRLTRFDVAADVEPEQLARRRLRQMVSEYRRGKCETRMRQGPKGSCKLVQSDAPGDGWTAYFGRPTSEVYIRAYDKRGPLRIEFQIAPQGRQERGILAQAVATADVPKLWRTYATRCIWPNDWYRQLVAGDVVELDSPDVLPSTFRDVLAAIQDQYGETLWALDKMGVSVAELLREPDPLTRTKKMRFKRLAEGANKAGYDGDELCRELEKMLPTRKADPDSKSEP